MLERVHERKEDLVGAVAPTHPVEGGDREIREAGGRPSVLVDLEAIEVVLPQAAPPPRLQVGIVPAGHRDQVARDPHPEPRVADLGHLAPDPVHDPCGPVLRYEPVEDGGRVHEREVIVVQLAVRTAPPSQDPGRRVEEGPEVGVVEPGGRGRVARRLARAARDLGHPAHAQEGAVRESIGVGVLAAEPYRVPPVGGPHSRHPLVPAAGIAGLGVPDEAVARPVGGQHPLRPLPDARVVCAEPDPVARPFGAVVRCDEERRKRVRRLVQETPAARGAVARHAVGLHPAENALQRLTHDVQGFQPLGQRRRPPGNVGVFVVAEGAGVAGRVVREHPAVRVELEHVEPVPSEAVVARVVRASDGRADRGHVQQVTRSRTRSGRRGK